MVILPYHRTVHTVRTNRYFWGFGELRLGQSAVYDCLYIGISRPGITCLVSTLAPAPLHRTVLIFGSSRAHGHGYTIVPRGIEIAPSS